MTDLAVKFYPADDVGGADIDTLDTGQLGPDTRLRVELNGFGTYSLHLNRHQIAVTDVLLARHNYMQWIDNDLGAVVAGSWVEDDAVDLINSNEQGGEDIHLNGPGFLGFLYNAVMLDEALSGAAGPFDIQDGYWRWNEDTYGGILRRVIIEATLWNAHSSGLYDDAFPYLGTLTWDDINDSLANPWPYSLGEWRVKIGTPLPDVVARLMRENIELLGNPVTFDLDAYVANTFGNSLDSDTFGSGVVRFEKGVNITSDLSRDMHAVALARRARKPGARRARHASSDASNVMVGGDDGITFRHRAAGSYPIVRAVAMQLDTTSDLDALDAAGDRSLTARSQHSDQIRLTHLMGDDPANGYYTPGPAGTGGHYWLGDIVRFHTGTGTYDYDEVNARITAIEYFRPDGVNWEATVETGGTFSSMPSIKVEPAPPVGLRLCNDTPEPEEN